MNYAITAQAEGDDSFPFAARRDKVKVRTPKDVLPLLGNIIHAEQECVMVITLDGNNQVSSSHMITVGLANQSQIHPREVFKWAVRWNSVSILVAHNHPSGNLEPSEADLVATKRLSEAGKLMGIPLLDHVIVSSEGFVSIREMKPGLFC
jgi:DNA repair protein RadC